MSDYYPYSEQTKTLNFRWLMKGGSDQRTLQQEVVIRVGIGAGAKYTKEWHAVPFDIEP